MSTSPTAKSSSTHRRESKLRRSISPSVHCNSSLAVQIAKLSSSWRTTHSLKCRCADFNVQSDLLWLRGKRHYISQLQGGRDVKRSCGATRRNYGLVALAL